MVCRKRRILKSYPDGEEDETGGRTRLAVKTYNSANVMQRCLIDVNTPS